MESLKVLPDKYEIVLYDDPLFAVYLRRHKLSDYLNKQYLCHWHKELEFIFVEKGTVCYSVNGSEIKIKAGEALFVNARTLHYGYSENNLDATYLCFVFSPSLISPTNKINEQYLEPIENNINLPFLIIDKDKTKEIYQDVLEMFLINNKKDNGYQLLIVGKIYLFWANFLKLVNNQKVEQLKLDNKTPLVKLMLYYIYNNYSKKLTIKDVTGAANISDSYGSHLFSEYLNQSIIDYLNSYRLIKASELLKESDKSITEITYEVGFSSPSYFTELFTREKKYSPKKYRDEVKKAR